ncbi:MAG: hypothetical protein V8S34_04580 [Lawsonibacter sp.]
MNLDQLMAWAQDKTRFQGPGDYADFCEAYLDFIFHGLQAVIVSQNENHYRFFQYREDGNFNVTRPVNSRLFLSQEDFVQAKGEFSTSSSTSATFAATSARRQLLNRFIYTCQAVHRRRPGCPPRREEQHRP